MPIANIPLPAPTAVGSPLDSFNAVLDAIQNVHKTRAAPQMALQGLLGSMPELMRGQKIYEHYASQYGENHPLTQEAFNNYRLLQDEMKTKMNYQNVIASSQGWKSLPSPVREALSRRAEEQGYSLPMAPTGAGFNTSGVASQQQYAGQSPNVAIPNQNQAIPEVKGRTNLSEFVPSAREKEQIKADIGVQTKEKEENIKLMNERMQSYEDSASAAKLLQGDLDRFNKAFNEINPKVRGLLRTSPGFMGKVYEKVDPKISVANKAVQNMIKNTASMFKGLGGIRIKGEFDMLQKALPQLDIPGASNKEIYDQLTLLNQVVMAQSKLAAGLKQSGIKDPTQFKNIIDTAMDYYPIIDPDGTMHPENVGKILSFASPQAVQAYQKGQEYIPDDMTGIPEGVNKLKEVALSQRLPLSEVIRRLKIARGIK